MNEPHLSICLNTVYRMYFTLFNEWLCRLVPEILRFQWSRFFSSPDLQETCHVVVFVTLNPVFVRHLKLNFSPQCESPSQ
jgi:hypothetical protein